MSCLTQCQTLREGLEGSKKGKNAEEFLIDKKNISMRSNQVWKFYYQKGYFDLNLFSNLPEEILKKLKEEIE